MGGRVAYCQRVEEKLRDWDDLFDELRDEAAGQTTRVRSRYARCAESFRPRHEEAQQRLASMLEAPDGQWRQLKPDLDASVDELRRVVERAKIV